MPVDLASAPFWMSTILDRKRRQEASASTPTLPSSQNKIEVTDLGKVPTWKRDILLKKNQKTSSVYLGRSDGSENKSGNVGLYSKKPDRVAPGDRRWSHRSRGSSVEEEIHGESGLVEDRLLPIHQNPILLNDLEKRPLSSTSGNSVSASFEMPQSKHVHGSSQRSGHSSKSSQSGSNGVDDKQSPRPGFEPDIVNDEVFVEEPEVSYGRGFVSKLLQKFRSLSSSKEEKVNTPVSPNSKRGSNDSKKSRDKPSLVQKKDNGRKMSLEFSATPLNCKSPTTSEEKFSKLEPNDIFNTNIVSNTKNIFEQVGSTSRQDMNQGKVTEDSIRLYVHNRSKQAEVSISPTPVVQSKSLKCQEKENGATYHGAQETRNATFLQDHHARSKTTKAQNNTADSPKSFNNLNTIVSHQNGSADIAQFDSGNKCTQNATNSFPNSANNVTSNIPVTHVSGLQTSIMIGSGIANDDVCEMKSHLDMNENVELEDRELTESQYIDAGSKLWVGKPQYDTSTGVTHISITMDDEDSLCNAVNKPITETMSQQIKDSCDREDSKIPDSKISDVSSSKAIPPSSAEKKLPEIQIKSNNNVNQSPTNEASKVEKRQAPSRPGMLLIRPASNLMAAKTKSEFLDMTKFNDIKKGEFAPAVRRPQMMHNRAGKDDAIDGDEDLEQGRVEDVDRSTYEFAGAGVQTGRSLLAKTKSGKKQSVLFNEDSLVSVYEYPAEPNFADPTSGLSAADDIEGKNGSESPTIEMPREGTASGLVTSLTIGSSSNLSSYKSKMQFDDYEFGSHRAYEWETPAVKETPAPEENKMLNPEPPVEVDSWASSSDLLF